MCVCVYLTQRFSIFSHHPFKGPNMLAQHVSFFHCSTSGVSLLSQALLSWGGCLEVLHWKCMILCKCMDLISVPVLRRKLLLLWRMFLKCYLHAQACRVCNHRRRPVIQQETSLAERPPEQSPHSGETEMLWVITQLSGRSKRSRADWSRTTRTKGTRTVKWPLLRQNHFVGPPWLREISRLLRGGMGHYTNSTLHLW